jgi:hypothetical protein
MKMKLRILKDGVYNDQFGRAQARQNGDLHETSPDYGKSLIESGFAEPYTEIVSAQPEQVADEDEKAARKTGSKKRKREEEDDDDEE